MDNSLLAVRDINHKYIVVDESANCAYLQELVQEIAGDKGFTVHLFECGEGDHVHCSFGKGSCGTIPIMWKRSDLYRKKTSAGTSNIRAKRTDTMEERKYCCQRKYP